MKTTDHRFKPNRFSLSVDTEEQQEEDTVEQEEQLEQDEEQTPEGGEGTTEQPPRHEQCTDGMDNDGDGVVDEQPCVTEREAQALGELPPPPTQQPPADFE
jgi:hypothetical protein